MWGRRVIGISGSLIWSKTLKELIFNPCGWILVSLEGPVSQSTLLTSTLVPLGSFHIYSDAKERVGCRKQWEATAPIESLVKQQPWFLSLGWKTCLWQNCSLGSCACSKGPALGQNTHDDDDCSLMLIFQNALFRIHVCVFLIFASKLFFLKLKFGLLNFMTFYLS